MQLSKNLKILLIFCIILGSSLPLIAWGITTYLTTGEKETNWSITLFGTTIDENATILYQEIMNESLFIHIYNAPFNYCKSNGQSSWRNFSGIPIWNLIVYSNISYGAANAIRFYDYQGQPSIVTLDISIVQNNATMVIIAYAEDEVLFGGPPSGEGPLKSIVDCRLTYPIISCGYATKWLAGIEFIIL
ncbi:MAG: hypothetical protein ACFFD2_06455 [Promethearchaeota archaeon]